MPIAVGETFERYEIESLIGRGGVGEVYRAVDTRLRRKVALKVLRPDREHPDAIARLFREARAAAVLTHPNTVAIHDIGEAEGICYIVMELVTGQPLLAYVGDERVPAARKLSWLVDVARALSAAHKAGIVHRDVKPSNVMVSDDGSVKVLDFGLAKPLAPVSFRTGHGQVVGTPRYMAPEQLAGAMVDARTDQYSFAVTAYELVAGTHPGGALTGSIAPPPLEQVAPEVTRAVADVIARAMANDPDRRFASMDDVAVALEDAIAGRQARDQTMGGPGGRDASDISPSKPIETKDAPTADTERWPETPDTADAPDSPDATAATTLPAGRPDVVVVPELARVDAEPIVRAVDVVAPRPPQEQTRTLLSRGAPTPIVPRTGKVELTTDVVPVNEEPVPAAEKAEELERAKSPAAAPKRGSPPDEASRSRRWLLMAVLLVVLGVATFAGAYFGTRQSGKASPTQSGPVDPPVVD